MLEDLLLQIDVGGQRGERKKWINVFGDVFILIFLTAISEYDQVIDEDKTTNRIEESLKLFNTILNYPVFMDKDVIVFLNKNDLLEQKIQERRSLLSDHFPEFTGDNHNVNEVRKFFQVMHYLLSLLSKTYLQISSHTFLNYFCINWHSLNEIGRF